jgi:hypothetical protein
VGIQYEATSSESPLKVWILADFGLIESILTTVVFSLAYPEVGIQYEATSSESPLKVWILADFGLIESILTRVVFSLAHTLRWEFSARLLAWSPH